MENATPNLREQGVQALREGNLDGAVDLLARAVMADGQDAEAQAFLGVAYSQKGLHPQAKRALQTAVELRPQEPHTRWSSSVPRHDGQQTNEGRATPRRYGLESRTQRFASIWLTFAEPAEPPKFMLPAANTFAPCRVS